MSGKTEKELRQEWCTPNDFWGTVYGEFYFDVDAAASESNALCGEWYGVDNVWVPEDTLMADEPHRVWINPGFKDLFPWMEKAYDAVEDGWCEVVVVMALVSPSTKWWCFAVGANRADEVRLLSPRVQFVAPEGIKQSSNARENCLVIFRAKPIEKPTTIWTWDWVIGGLKK